MKDNKQSYKIAELGMHSTRRDYSKVSGSLELPNLVEVQTDSFKWFTTEGIKEVFDDIYPIQNYGGNIRLNLIDFEFGEPKYSVAESKYREINYCAPLKANMTEEINEIDNALNKLNTKLIKKEEFLLPFEKSVRTILLFQKVQDNLKYPRKYSEIKKNRL